MFVLSLVLGVVQIMFGLLLKIFNRKGNSASNMLYLPLAGLFIAEHRYSRTFTYVFSVVGTAHTIVALAAVY